MEYRLLHHAAEELGDAVSYYEGKSRGLASEFLDEFDSAMSLITEMPETWSLVDPVFRRFILRRFPYCIFFRLDGAVVVVTSVFHQHRKPEDWRSNK